MIVKLKQGVSPASIIPAYIPGAVIQPLRHSDVYLVYVPNGTSSSASSQLAAHSLVEFTEPNRLRHSTIQSPNDPQVASQWALSAVQAQQAWLMIPDQYLTSALAGNGTGRIKVAILDTGIDCTHPDFANSGGSSDDAAQGGQILFSASKAPVPTTVSPATCAFQDDYGHGTHVAGIIAAATQNATGIASLGFPLELIAYKVLDKTGAGTDTVIANAIMDAAAAGAQIISLSLGGPDYSQTLQLAINYAWQHNSLVVAAAGNSSSSRVFYPADANFAVGVSATDSSGNLASFSNFGNGISVAAPGVSILSTLPTYANTLGTQNYGYLSGTSMATPHVSALAGLVSMTTPNASAAAILERIQQSAASPIVNGGWDQKIGYGIINAYDAVSGTLRPASLGSLVGQIVDGSATPVNGATIVVNGQSVTTDATGLYRFPSLAAGLYSVSVTAVGFLPQSLTAVITPGADTKLQVTMGVTYGKFTGTVTDSGPPVAGAVVEALSGGVIVATAFTDINGQYSLWVAGGGTYDLSVSAISKTTTTATARSVAAAGTSTVNLTVAKLGIVSGAVRNASQQAVSNAQIFLSGPGSTWGAVSDANGNYSSIGLPAGTYTLTCSASGLPTSVISNVVVSADSVTAVNCQLGQQATQSAPAGFVLISPANGGTAVSLTASLSWGVANGAASYDVYFGSSSSPAFVANTTATSYSPGTLSAGTTYHWQVTAKNGAGSTSSATWSFTTTTQSGPAALSRVGVFRSGQWNLDLSGTANWSAATDFVGGFGLPGDIPVIGDWDGSGIAKIGVFRNGMWFLDMNGNGQWDGPVVDRMGGFGLPGDIPVVGDWTGDGKTKVGVFRNGVWSLDLNGNLQWDGTAVDRAGGFGLPGDIPVVGDWTGDGKTKVGVFRNNGVWSLDLNGNLQWDGTAVDRAGGFGLPGDIPVVGDWTGDGKTKVGVFRNNGVWSLDLNGNLQWDGTAVDGAGGFGLPGDIPVVGDWTGDGKTKVGVFRNGVWSLDLNGNVQWDGTAVDRAGGFGLPGDIPVVGRWTH